MERKQAVKCSLLLLLALVLIMISISSVSAAAVPVEKPIKFYVQGKEMKPVNAPIIRGGRVYVEFRSAVKALGFTFNYDKSKKIITARSEDAFFKIDLNSGTTYVNGRMFRYDWATPAIIESGANTLVLGHLFHATDYLYADYYPDKNIAEVYESAWGKPKKADLRMIRSILETHYYTVSEAAELRSFELKSWGSFVTIHVDAFIPKSGEELLDRMLHADIEMKRVDDKGWAIHKIMPNIEFLDYESLPEREVEVPSADKTEIYALVEAYIKALNDKDAAALIALLPPDYWLEKKSPSKEQLEQYYSHDLFSYNFEYKLNQAAIVSYEANKAKVYIFSTMIDKDNPLEEYPSNYLQDVVQASDGKWYMNFHKFVLLNSEIWE
ncbi:Copper amine oxidase N-terminal domain-containing protein [Paenibacillus algorifonticola]|uniref:Copper amine oxidase N-terminal domain-containing protein n=1 Tax=Paenibacillus algorifonticola TaxID=684063 RepID=A0A1I2HNX1_9BACL|nr:stalk domain-containing protein [Paenibacillus algorifonticola]SFF31218.1 Copper amine oxidase N-terminal domain-containing protein [Paenibacillus algorifonticola]